MLKRCLLFCASLALAAATARAAGALDVYWVDVEGGGGTLIITPAGESILIDTGWPGERDAARIRDTASQAGVSRIDFLILTHFHVDHFGGAASLARLIPVVSVYDNGIPEHNPDGGNDQEFLQSIKPYREFPAGRRLVVHPGDSLPLRQTPTGPAVSLRFLAAAQKTIEPPPGAPRNPLCGGLASPESDSSDNKNSVVSLLQFGPFRFFDGGDLTWSMEGRLVCPVNLPGKVDVYQVNHHGLDISNNPLLLQSLSPAVAVMNNGALKGGAVKTIATLKALPGLKAVFQMHKDLSHGPDANVADENIANLGEKCDGNLIRMTVDPDGAAYTLWIPATGRRQKFRSAF